MSLRFKGNIGTKGTLKGKIIPTGPDWDNLIETKVLASDGLADDRFGISASMSADGNTAIVGAYKGDTISSNEGAAYIYTRSGSTWTEQAKIQASDGLPDDQFGYRVGISDDGQTVIVGAPLADPSGVDRKGATYIFARSGNDWIETKILHNGNPHDHFGIDVSISGDGQTAIVGAHQSDGNGPMDAGAAYIFTRSGITWTEQKRLVASDGAQQEYFGTAVSISGNGQTAIVGAYADDTTPGERAGSAYIFTGLNWAEEQQITASDKEALDQFGKDVSISGDGLTAMVGASYEDTGGDFAGSVYSYTWDGNEWTEQKIQASNKEQYSQFGESVSISSDGNTAIIGSPERSINGVRAGAAYIFTRSEGVWTELMMIEASDREASDWFGVGVGIANNGTSLAGAYGEDTNGSNDGAAYFYS